MKTEDGRRCQMQRAWLVLLAVALWPLGMATHSAQEPLRLEIDFPPESGSKDGLAITDSKTAGRNILVDLKLVNVSSEPTFVQDTCIDVIVDNFAYCDLQIGPITVERRGGETIIPGTPTGDFGPSAGPDSFIKLNPGHFIGKRMRAYLVKYIGELSHVGVSPGLYEIRATYMRTAAKPELEWDFQPWHGTLTSNPLHIRVVSANE